MLSGGTVGAIAFAANTALAGAALALFRQDPPGRSSFLMLPGRAIATLLVRDDRVNPFGGFNLLAICTATNAVGGFFWESHAPRSVSRSEASNPPSQ